MLGRVLRACFKRCRGSVVRLNEGGRERDRCGEKKRKKGEGRGLSVVLGGSGDCRTFVVVIPLGVRFGRLFV